MACPRITQSFPRACKQTPGVKKIWLANKADLISYGLNAAADTVSGLTFSGATGSNLAFYSITFEKGVASIMETPALNIQNSVTSYKPQIQGFLAGMDATARALFYQLTQAQVVAVVQTLDGSYFIAGISNGLDCTAANWGTEAGADGKRGLSFTLEGLEPSPPYLLATTLSFETSYVVS